MVAQTMSHRPLVALGPDADQAAAQALRRSPAVDVVEGPESAVIVAGDAFPTEIAVAELTDLEPLLERHSQGLVVAVKGVLDDEAAARLEDAGIAYVDAAQRTWFPGQPQTPRARSTRSTGGGRLLRSAGIRLAQLLADHPAEAWTQRSLAERGDSTPVTAQTLLKRLEREGLVERHGRGRATERRAADVVGLRRWLARHGAPGRVKRLLCFVSDPGAASGGTTDYPVVLTGAAAADQVGLPVLSTVQRPSYRVAVSGQELEHVPEAIGGFRTERGANAVLISDPGRLALTDARRNADGGLVAPPSRVMLDLYLEPRGEAAVDAFLDLWGAKQL